MAYKNIEKKRANDRAYYHKNKDKIKNYLKIYRKNNREKIKITENKRQDLNIYRAWEGRIKRWYGINGEQYHKMLMYQDNCCAICKRHKSASNRRLAVDHCHTTGKVRGLLCPSCNRAVGCLKDNVKLCYSAAEYLKKNTPSETNPMEYMI